jgi:hypothetical protein
LSKPLPVHNLLSIKFTGEFPGDCVDPLNKRKVVLNPRFSFEYKRRIARSHMILFLIQKTRKIIHSLPTS